MDIVNKISITIGFFLLCLVGSAILVPILAAILGVFCGIVSVLLIPAVLIKLCFQFQDTIENLTEYIKYDDDLGFRCWQIFCLFPIVAVVGSVPSLFVLSLILHWHLAATIVFGSMTSLGATVAAVVFTVIWYQDAFTQEPLEEEPTKKEPIKKTVKIEPYELEWYKNQQYKNQPPIKKNNISSVINTFNALGNQNNIKRRNSLSEKDINKIGCFSDYFQKDEDENKNNNSCKSLPMATKHVNSQLQIKTNSIANDRYI